MKKTGFTLAEVLITLTIIGVVATMTLPALMTNVQEQQGKTGLKKGLNTLTEAAQMSQAVEGFDYASIKEASAGDDGEETQSVYGLLRARTQVDLSKSQAGGSGVANSVDSTGTNFVVFFRDGSAVSFPSSATPRSDFRTIQDDGLAMGFGAIYDINGEKKPNVLSNCKGDLSLTSTGEDNASSNCSNRSTRVIRDQFAIRLRGAYAQPNGAAARWAFEN